MPVRTVRSISTTEEKTQSIMQKLGKLTDWECREMIESLINYATESETVARNIVEYGGVQTDWDNGYACAYSELLAWLRDY